MYETYILHISPREAKYVKTLIYIYNCHDKHALHLITFF